MAIIDFNSLRQALRALPPTFSATGTSPGWHTKSAAYWLEVCRAHGVKKGQVKTAALGGSQDTPFEQAFSNLAHAYVKDKAPQLLDYEVGFQLLEKNQENTKAVGVLGYKIGSMWVYIPVFFLNGDLKGHEMMYLKNQDHFLPLSEGWVDHVIGKKPVTLGDGVNRNLSLLGIMPPNLYQLSRSPQKFASDHGGYEDATTVEKVPHEQVDVENPGETVVEKVPHLEADKEGHAPVLAGWAKAALPQLAYVAMTPVEKQAKYKDKNSDMLLPGFLKRGGEPVVRYLLEKVGSAYPDLIQAIDRFYGPEMLSDVISHVNREKRAANSKSLTKSAALSALAEKLPADWNGTMTAPNQKNGGCGSYGLAAWESADGYRPSKGYTADLNQAARVKYANCGMGGMMPSQPPAPSKPKKKPLYKKKIFKKRGSIIPSIIGPIEAGAGEHKVISKEMVDGDPQLIHSLSADERQTMLKERVVYRDTRDKKDVTIAYDVQSPLRLYNPDHTNIYWVLVQPDHFEKCLVIKGPYTNQRRENYVTVVRLDGKKEYVNTHPANVWCRAEYDQDAWKKWYATLEKADSVPLQRKKKDKYGDGEYFDYHDDRCFVLLTESGDGSVPFRAREEYDADSEDYGKLYDVRFEDHRSGRRPAWLPDHNRHRHDSYAIGSNFGDIEQLVLSKKPGSKFKAHDGQLCVPAEVKRLQVRDEDSMASSNSTPLRLGDLGQLQAMIMSNTHPIRIVSDGKDVEVNEQRMSKKEATIHLFEDWGLSEKQAKDIVDTATKLKHLELRAQFPDGYEKAADDPQNDMIRGAPNAPPFPEPYMGYDPMTGGNVPTMQESEFNFKIPDMSAAKTDRSIYYPFGPDPKAMQSAQQAAQSGQKEVFDTAMLGGLLKSMRQDSMIDQNMGDLMKGLDRLGRILFQYYWHGEEFEERYGKQEMPELEDGLRNSFEGLGDIILALKQKGPDVQYEDSKVDLSNLANN